MTDPAPTLAAAVDRLATAIAAHVEIEAAREARLSRGQPPPATPYAVPCPYCDAGPREPCATSSGPYYGAHGVRSALARGEIDWPPPTVSARDPSPAPAAHGRLVETLPERPFAAGDGAADTGGPFWEALRRERP